MYVTLLLFFLLYMGYHCLAQGSINPAPQCRSTDYNKAGVIRLNQQILGQACAENFVQLCWQSAEIFECVESNRELNIDGAVLVWPLQPLAISKKNATVFCPTAIGAVRGKGVPQGFVQLDNGEIDTFSMQGSDFSNIITLNLPTLNCQYQYRLSKATSDILDTEPEIYGRWSSAWKASNQILATITIVLAALFLISIV